MSTNKESVNIVLIGHVDAGKSTIAGHLLLLTGNVDDRTIARNAKDAKENNKESWGVGAIMDTDQEERLRSKTVEIGRAHFATTKKRYTILDAPGHKNYIPNMIGGVTQADVGILVISARKGEFESGFIRGGQTREHTMLAKALGITKLIILVNKMDTTRSQTDVTDTTRSQTDVIEWNAERFNYIKTKFDAYLKKLKYTDVIYCPCSGVTGANLTTPTKIPWYDGLSLLDTLDSLDPIPRQSDAALRIPIISHFKDGGLFILGKVESGSVRVGDELLMMPSRKPVSIIGIEIDDHKRTSAACGENVLLKVKGVTEDEIRGVLCQFRLLCNLNNTTPLLKHGLHSSPNCSAATKFDAQILVADREVLIAPGYECVLHLNVTTIDCIIIGIKCIIDKKGRELPGRPRFLRSNTMAIVRVAVKQPIAIDTFGDYPAMGRFILRNESETVAIGKVIQLR